MRKNRMLRLASVLLICVLLTSSIISGTFAKYVTVAEVTDSARVAKWGVTFAATSDLFATAYKDEAVTDSTATVKVIDDTSKLVAPGTKGTGLDVSISGDKKAEVSYNMTIKLDTDNSKMPKLTYTPTTGSADPYQPVKFSIFNGDTKLVENKSFSDLTTLFNGTNVLYKYDVAAGKYYIDKDCNGTIDTTEGSAADAPTDPPKIKIKWEWPISDGNTDADKLNSKLDTILGDLAAGIDVTNTTAYKLPDGIASVNTTTTGATIYNDVKLTWTVTAAQID